MRRLRFGEEDLRAEELDAKPKKRKQKPPPKKDNTTIDTDGDGYTNDDIANKADPTDTDGDGYIGDDEAHKTAHDDADKDGYSGDDTAKTADKSAAGKKLKFSKQEQKIGKLEGKSGEYNKKLDKARDNLPTQKILKKERVFDEKTGKTKSKLTFEKKAIPIGEAKWNVRKKKSLPRKAVGAVKTAGVNKLHSKVYQISICSSDRQRFPIRRYLLLLSIF